MTVKKTFPKNTGLVKALEEERAHLEMLFEGLQEGIVMVDSLGIIKRVNREFERLFGYSSDEAVGKSIDDLVAPDELNEEARSVTSAVVTGKKQILETKRLCKDGSVLNVSVIASPISVDNQVVGYYGVYRDISGRKKAESDLRHQKALLEQLFESAQEGIVMVANDGIILNGNGEFLRMFGFELFDIKGRNIDDIITSEDSLEEAINITDRVSSGLKVSFETTRTRKDGTKIEVSLLASPIVIDNVQVAFYGIYRDITERKRATERLNRSRRRIESLHGIARNLEKSDSEKKVYDCVISAACMILDFPACSISVIRKDRLVPAFFSTPDLAEMLRDSFLPGSGLAGRSYMLRKTLLATHDTSPDQSGHEDNHSSYFPLIGSPVGTIGVFTGFGSGSDRIEDEQASLLELLLGHASEAVNRIRLHRELRAQAIHDPMTSVFNRLYFDEAIRKEVERARRYNHSIGIVMIDIDNFKEVNDRFGHQKGDEVLCAVAGKLQEVVRKADDVIRYGGDEFLIILPETGEGIDRVVKRLRANLIDLPEISSIVDFPVTLSIGSAVWDPEADITIDQILTRADKLMYKSKKKHHKLENESDGQH
ncbi:MAG: PAS domain S-box protein [Candidatus Aegiribacteria sp.]|nr:PAS domain S-box protein [Candidatus Aegiribacteria sp.]